MATGWANVVHALIVAAQAVQDKSEIDHLIGGVPALPLDAAVLWYLSPSKALAASGT